MGRYKIVKGEWQFKQPPTETKQGHSTSFIIPSNTLEDNISEKPRPFVRVVPIDGLAVNCRPFALVKKLAIVPKIGMIRRHSLQVRAANFAGRNFLHDRLNNGPCHGSFRHDDRRGPVRFTDSRARRINVHGVHVLSVRGHRFAQESI